MFTTISGYLDDAAEATKRRASAGLQGDAAAMGAAGGGARGQPATVKVSELGAEEISDAEMEDVLSRHLKVMDEVFAAYVRAETTLNLAKCAFLTRAWSALGFITDGRHVAIDPSRTSGFAALADEPVKHTTEWLRRVVGVLQAHSSAVGAKWLQLSEPLLELLAVATREGQAAMRPGVPNPVKARHEAAGAVERGWTAGHSRALKEIVELLCLNAVRALHDPTKPSWVMSDASDKGAGLRLVQFHDGVPYTVAVAQVRFRGSQLKWGPGVRELYSLLQGMRRWWRMLFGAKVFWVNDHQNLMHVQDLEAPFIQRWLMELSLHPAWRNGTRVYIDGKGMALEDALSRLPGGEQIPPSQYDGTLVPAKGSDAPMRAPAEYERILRDAALGLKEKEEVAVLAVAAATTAPQAAEAAEKLADVTVARGDVLRETLRWLMQDLPPVQRERKHESVYSDLAWAVLEAQRGMTEPERQELKRELGKRLVEHQLDGKPLWMVEERVVLPRSAEAVRNELFRRFHNVLHEGWHVLVAKLRASGLYVVGASKYAEDFYEACPVCQKARAGGRRNLMPLLLRPPAPRPLTVLYIDFLYLSAAKWQNKSVMGVFVIVDDFTGYTLFEPAVAVSAAEARRCLECWRRCFGYPLEVRVDGGSEFKGEFEEACKDAGVYVDRGTAYHHRGRGPVERKNGRLIQLLKRQLPAGKLETWPTVLAAMAPLVNMVPSKKQGGYSPYQLLFTGAPTEMQRLWGQPEGDLEKWRNTTAALRAEAQLSAELWAIKQKTRFDAKLEVFNPRTGERAPKVGDWVLKENVIPEGKLAPAFMGVYAVTGDMGEGWFKIQLVMGGKPGSPGYPILSPKEEIVVLDRLWPFDHSATTADAELQWQLPEGWYTVEEVLSGPNDEGKFQVKWTHRSEPTWEYAQAMGADNVVFKAFCEREKIDREAWLRAAPVGVAAEQPALAGGGGRANAHPRAAARQGDEGGGGAPARRKAQYMCPVCGETVTPRKEDNCVKMSHLPCSGAGKRAIEH
jgi:polyhydroxyalkanoate synthesis regulator phasin